jgi:hypothetical protein
MFYLGSMKNVARCIREIKYRVDMTKARFQKKNKNKNKNK